MLTDETLIQIVRNALQLKPQDPIDPYPYVLDAMREAYRRGIAGAQDAIDAERNACAAKLQALENKLRLFQSPRYHLSLRIFRVDHYLKRSDQGMAWIIDRDQADTFDLHEASREAKVWGAVLVPAR